MAVNPGFNASQLEGALRAFAEMGEFEAKLNILASAYLAEAGARNDEGAFRAALALVDAVARTPGKPPADLFIACGFAAGAAVEAHQQTFPQSTRKVGHGLFEVGGVTMRNADAPKREDVH